MGPREILKGSATVAHIDKRSDRPKPWRVRYRDPAGRERARSFARKIDAEKFMATVQADVVRGDWIDPRLTQTTVAAWAERWLLTKSHLKPKSLAGYKSILRSQVLPAFGSHQLRQVDRMAVEEWIAALRNSGLGASSVRQARQLLNNMLDLAVEAGYLANNPVHGVRAPRQPEPEMKFLTANQVDQLATAITTPYGTLIYLLAYGGLRWGEATALRRNRCHLDTSRIEVAESLAEAEGKLHFGATKTHRRRIVGLPEFLRDRLVEHLDHHVDANPRALVFTSPQGTPLRNSNFRRQAWYAAVSRAQLPEGLRIHDLRHTCASLLIAAQANPKAVQNHLGHSSIAVTMDRYTHLFPAETDALIERLNSIRTHPLAYQMRTKSPHPTHELGL